MARYREGTWPKIIRAEELLASIKAEIDTYVEGDPYRVTGHFTPDRTGYTAWVELAEAPPIRLSILIGDFAHNLRSALDHLTDRLVRRNNGKPTDQTQFPIRLNCLYRGVPTPLRIAGGVSMDAMTIIEALQPYHRAKERKRHPLAWLRALSNTDKHRNLILASLYLSDAQVTLAFRDGAMFSQYATGRFHDRAPVAHFPFAEVVPQDAEVQVGAYGHALITFDEPDLALGEVPVVKTLTEILQFVSDDVVRRMERLLLLGL